MQFELVFYETGDGQKPVEPTSAASASASSPVMTMGTSPSPAALVARISASTMSSIPSMRATSPKTTPERMAHWSARYARSRR